MLDLFIKGGPIMWPLLLTSIIAFGVVIERLWFVEYIKNVKSLRLFANYNRVFKSAQVDATTGKETRNRLVAPRRYNYGIEYDSGEMFAASVIGRHWGGEYRFRLHSRLSGADHYLSPYGQPGSDLHGSPI